MTSNLVLALSVLGGLTALGLLAWKAGRNCTP